MRKFFHTLINNANDSELMRLTLLGIVSGFVAGGVVLLFRLGIDNVQNWILPGDHTENYEALSSWAIFSFPLIGGIILGALFHFLSPEYRQVGVVHTLEFIKYQHGKLPIINGIIQFISAAISIIAGHSVGREGPCIHLGATSGSAVAVAMNVSPKVRRTLLACGVSAAIAASFNTPLAGVIFAMEVILIEYTVASMLPMIIAASVATLLTHAVYGNEVALLTPTFNYGSNIELIGVAVTGILVGIISVIFVRLLVSTTTHTKHYPIFWRLTAAGAITGVLALMAPEIMSIGYDTVNATFYSQIALVSLLVILVMKVVATSVGLGLGLPGGLIGPTLFIGAVAGSAIGTIIHILYPNAVTDPAVYAMIGMGAMMSATIQAPLAALLAIFELTHEPAIIFPGLIAIVFANLTSSEMLNQRPVFQTLMRLREVKTPGKKLTPNTQLIAAIDKVDKYFIRLPHLCSPEKLAKSLDENLHWVLIEEDHEPVLAIRTDMLKAINFSQIETIDLLALKHLGYAVKKLPSTSPIFDVVAQTKILKSRTVFLVYDQTEPQEQPPLLGILHPKDASELLPDSQ